MAGSHQGNRNKGMAAMFNWKEKTKIEKEGSQEAKNSKQTHDAARVSSLLL